MGKSEVEVLKGVVMREFTDGILFITTFRRAKSKLLSNLKDK